MARQVKRPYESQLRRRRAEATRRRIRRAGLAAFQSRGYVRTTIAAVAARAEVAVDTVYALFGSKAGLLEAIIVSAETSGMAADLFTEVAGETDPRRALRGVARINRLLGARFAALLPVVAEAERTDPRLGRLVRQGNARRLRDQRRVAVALASDRALKPGVNTQRAADVIWALTGPELQGMLVRQRRWSPRRFEAWLADALARLLLR